MFNDPQFTILLSDAPLDFFYLNCLLLVFCMFFVGLDTVF